ncbi:MAG: hypothetical protein HEQ39_10930 [Rhizobacter sp.]
MTSAIRGYCEQAAEHEVHVLVFSQKLQADEGSQRASLGWAHHLNALVVEMGLKLIMDTSFQSGLGSRSGVMLLDGNRDPVALPTRLDPCSHAHASGSYIPVNDFAQIRPSMNRFSNLHQQARIMESYVLNCPSERFERPSVPKSVRSATGAWRPNTSQLTPRESNENCIVNPWGEVLTWPKDHRASLLLVDVHLVDVMFQPHGLWLHRMGEWTDLAAALLGSHSLVPQSGSARHQHGTSAWLND